MSQYDADALMAYFKKHQISREPDEAKRIPLYKGAANYVIDEALQIVPIWGVRVTSMNEKIINWDKAPVWKGNGNYNAYRTTVA